LILSPFRASQGGERNASENKSDQQGEKKMTNSNNKQAVAVKTRVNAGLVVIA
jgi:hypothetical protein